MNNRKARLLLSEPSAVRAGGARYRVSLRRVVVLAADGSHLFGYRLKVTARQHRMFSRWVEKLRSSTSRAVYDMLMPHVGKKVPPMPALDFNSLERRIAASFGSAATEYSTMARVMNGVLRLPGSVHCIAVNVELSVDKPKEDSDHE